MKKHLLVVLLAVHFFVSNSLAQKQGQELIDSLVRALPAMKDDTNKVHALGNISFNYRLINTKKSLKYGERCLELATRLQWPKGIGKGHIVIGTCYKFESNYPEALKHYHKALSVFEQNDLYYEEAITHLNIGTVYRPLKEYQKALKSYNKALRLARKTGDKKTQAQALGNKGVIYFENKQFIQQQTVSLEALKLFRELNDQNNEAWILSNLGDSFAANGHYEKCIDYHLKAIAIYEALDNLSYKATSLLSLGQMYTEMAKRAPSESRRNELIEQAIQHLQEARDILTELDDPEYLKDTYFTLSEVLELKGDYSAALEAYQRYTVIREDLDQHETKEQIAALETEREIEIREREIEIQRLKKRTEFLYFAGGIGVLLLVIGFTVSNNRRQRKMNGLLTVEKQKSEELLHNILPEEVASELKVKGKADARLFNNVTVLFTDFVGFTRIAEKLSPQELVEEIDTCFREFDRIIEKYNVEKIKTIGDAYMAAGGLPVENTTNAANVVSAALEIQAFMAEMVRERTDQGKPAFRIRIGVHSGPVVAGIVGVKKFAYDIWGDTVNTASRMESSGEEGKVNISGTTYALIQAQFDCTHRGKIAAKNKGEIDMYFVNGKIV